MEFEQLCDLIRTVSESSLTGFKYEENGVKISMNKEQVQVVTAGSTAPVTMPVTTSSATTAAAPAEVQMAEPTGSMVESPLVGTFYNAPSEEANPFVNVGDTVKKGQILAIVEAMKLMNDIESDFEGTIAEIYIENGSTVEYGQPLFRII